MKKNLIMLLVVGAVAGTLLTGCGSKDEPVVENDTAVESTKAVVEPNTDEGVTADKLIRGDEDKVDKSTEPTETEEPTATAEPVATEEPVATPEPTKEPEKEVAPQPTEKPTEQAPQTTEKPVENQPVAGVSNYLTDHGYTINSNSGEYTYTAKFWNQEASTAFTDTAKMVATLSQKDNGDGTQTITLVTEHYSHYTNESKTLMACDVYQPFFVDKYTGKTYIAEHYDTPYTFNVVVGDKTYSITYTESYSHPAEVEGVNNISTQTVVCPIEYDGTVLFCTADDVFGKIESAESTLDQIVSKQYDTLFFGIQ